MTAIETNGDEIAMGVNQLLDDLTVKSKRFYATHGKLNVMFNSRKRLIHFTAELKGEFVTEFDVDVTEFAKEPEGYFAGIRKDVTDIMFAALQRRHSERSLYASIQQQGIRA